MSREIFKEMKEELVGIMDAMNSINLLRDKIHKDFDLEGIRTALNALPGVIANKQKEAREPKNQATEIDGQMKVLEAELAFQIKNDVNGKGKANFSNADERKAELIIRLAKDESYQKLNQEKVALEMQAFNLEMEVQRLQSEYRTALALKDLAVAEMGIYSK